MSIQLDQINTETNNVDPYLIEKVWRDLDGQLSREYVGRVVANVALGFQNAKVKTLAKTWTPVPTALTRPPLPWQATPSPLPEKARLSMAAASLLQQPVRTTSAAP